MEEAMDYRHIESVREGDFRVITMVRPEKRNALSEAHLLELLDAFERVGTSDARGAILAARGPVFSAGHDFSDMANRDEKEMRELLATCSELMQKLAEIPQVVIAQVEGLATAAGCQLVASCDLAVAGESARFAVPGGRGGLFCTTPGVALARAIGRKHAVEMLLTGDEIDAPTAVRWGLVNRVVPDARVAEETRELLRRATRGSALSKALGKQALYQQIELSTREAYAFASDAMAAASQTAPAKEGMRAFLEKRKASYSE
jgi:enoyl-CoA hydratase/carnithine racemase